MAGQIFDGEWSVVGCNVITPTFRPMSKNPSHDFRATEERVKTWPSVLASHDPG